jgi:DNA-binding transcriptional LysR family regulator
MTDDVPEASFSGHLQTVLSSRSSQARRRRFKLPASVVWRASDMALKRAALLAGLGWGRLPGHLAEPELAAGAAGAPAGPASRRRGLVHPNAAACRVAQGRAAGACDVLAL